MSLFKQALSMCVKHDAFQLRQGQTFAGLLNGEYYASVSDLDLDTDGVGRWAGDSTRQSDTALHDHGHALDSNAVAYVVLPGGATFAKLGTVATVIRGDHIAHAVVGDIGPRKKIGEGSIHLHRLLGHEVVDRPGHVRNVGLNGDVLCIWWSVDPPDFSQDSIDAIGAGMLQMYLPTLAVVEASGIVDPEHLG